MKKKYGFSIFGADLRQKELYRMLAKDGYKAVYNSDREIYNNVILPVRPDKDYSYLIEKLGGSKIFLGKKDMWTNLYPELKKEKLVDYTADEAFCIVNAHLTAEGALSAAIDNSDKSLFNSRVLIVGSGRIGTALALLLLPFTKDITVSSRKASDKAKISCMGLHTAETACLPELSYFDYIFSTVPCRVFCDDRLSEMKNALLIDLASVDCANLKLCKEMNINAIKASSLPGKYSPYSASKTLKDTVLRIIEED